MKRILVSFLVLCMHFSAYAQNPKTPMMGWSSWNTFRIRINDDLIRQTADAMVEKGLKEAGYTFINIDDGFFYGRDDDGNLLIHPEKFPQGLKPVADYIHSLGLKAGIYSDVGIRTCGSIWDNDPYGMNVGLWNHEDRDLDFYFNRCGFDYIKVDFCGGEQVSEPGRMTDEEKYRAVAEAVRRVGGEDIRLNICRWQFPGTWVTDLASSWRVTPDIRPDFDQSPYGVMGILEKSLYLSAYASPGHFNDMDMMQLGRGKMTHEEEKTHFGVWCIMSSPLMIGCDLRTIPESTLEIITNKEVIAVNQDTLGMQARLVFRDGKRMILAKPVEKRYGTIRAVALVNGEDEAQTMWVDFTDLQLEGNVKVRDLWNHRDLGEYGYGFFETEVPPHGTAMLRLEGEKRINQRVYQAEDAFLNEFLGVYGAPGKARPVLDSLFSGGAGVTQLGNHPDNWMEFRDVYVAEGGKYDLRIFSRLENSTDLTVFINGKKYSLDEFVPLFDKEMAVLGFKIILDPGLHTIRLGNPDSRAPDIDKIELSFRE